MLGGILSASFMVLFVLQFLQLRLFIRVSLVIKQPQKDKLKLSYLEPPWYLPFAPPMIGKGPLDPYVCPSNLPHPSTHQAPIPKHGIPLASPSTIWENGSKGWLRGSGRIKACLELWDLLMRSKKGGELWKVKWSVWGSGANHCPLHPPTSQTEALSLS
jgi:hypothetical protein